MLYFHLFRYLRFPISLVPIIPGSHYLRFPLFWFPLSLVPIISGSHYLWFPLSPVPIISGYHYPLFSLSMVSFIPGSHYLWFPLSLGSHYLWFPLLRFPLSMVPIIQESHYLWFPLTLDPIISGSHYLWFPLSLVPIIYMQFQIVAKVHSLIPSPYYAYLHSPVPVTHRLRIKQMSRKVVLFHLYSSLVLIITIDLNIADQLDWFCQFQLANWAIHWKAAECLLDKSDKTRGELVFRGQHVEVRIQSRKGGPC